MALYLLSKKYVSRGQGRTSVGAAAYRSGTRLHQDGHTYDYTRRNDVVHSEIILPESAPPEFSDRQILWSAVEKSEDNSTRWKTARTANEIVIALPRELTWETNIALVKEFATKYFVENNRCADIAIHRGDDKEAIYVEGNHLEISKHNPHAHILLTTRPVGPGGFSNRKAREWDNWGDSEPLIQLRKQWADIQNMILQQKGLEISVSHLSYKAQGLDREPGLHLGPVIAAMNRRGKKTRLGEKNRAIEVRNKELSEHKRQQERDKEIERGYEWSR
jgi:ATP-dependent exoDNAse (exonuclease V) alpha subunit